MAFYGTDLYMAEEGTPVLQNGNVNSVKRGSFNTLIAQSLTQHGQGHRGFGRIPGRQWSVPGSDHSEPAGYRDGS